MGWYVDLPTGSKLTPGLRDGHAKGGEKREDGAQENCATTTEQIVERISDPTGAGTLLVLVSLIGGKQPTYKRQMVM